MDTTDIEEFLASAGDTPAGKLMALVLAHIAGDATASSTLQAIYDAVQAASATGSTGGTSGGTGAV